MSTPLRVFGTRVHSAQVKWLVLAIVGASGIVLGFIGWLDYLKAKTPGDVAEAGYRTIALLGFSGAPQPPLPWTLGTARFIVPVVVGWSTIAALLLLYRDRLQLLGLPFRRGHVVVVGLGDKGLAFTRSSRLSGYRVVAIERDPAAPAVKAVRELGGLVITGDGRDPEILMSAGITRAGAVFAVTDEDGVNAEIVLQCSDLEGSGTPKRSRKLAHVSDPGLTGLLRLHQLRRSEDSRALCDYFSVDDHGARGIVGRYAKANNGRWRSPLIAVGFSALNQRLVLEFARLQSRETGEPLQLVVVDEEVDSRWESLLLAQPDLQAVVNAQLVRRMSSVSIALERPAVVMEPLVVIDLMNDGATIKEAISIRVMAEQSRASIVVVTRRSSGMRQMINSLQTEGLANVHAYPLIESCCTYDLIDLGILEVIARIAHDRYAHERLKAGVAETDPALQSWEELDPAYRESTREQARHIATKLRSIGCSIVPYTDWQPPDFTFTSDEVELLAIQEHERWCAERRLAGWRLGPRDLVEKQTPYLVRWSELDEGIRELDREMISGIPMLLFEAGAAIERESEGGGTPAG